MGMLVNGIWYHDEPPHEALRLTSGDGSFVRPESGFRDRVTGRPVSKPRPGDMSWLARRLAPGRTARC
jgi:hypothetical protein